MFKFIPWNNTINAWRQEEFHLYIGSVVKKTSTNLLCPVWSKYYFHRKEMNGAACQGIWVENPTSSFQAADL